MSVSSVCVETSSPSVVLLNDQQLCSEPDSNSTNTILDGSKFRPENIKLVSILNNDPLRKSVTLHVRFDQIDDKESKDGIIIFMKSTFPNNPQQLKNDKVIGQICSSPEQNIENRGEHNEHVSSHATFPDWKATLLATNDVYHRLVVAAGLESVNEIDMSVIYPAEERHFKKYTPSARHIIHETPDMYEHKIVPFLSITPKDLSWVDNIINSESEQDRVIYRSADPQYGFTVVMDYRWSGKQLNNLHYLALIHNPALTCLRDLRSEHIPMLRELLQLSRNLLASKYSKPTEEEVTSSKSDHKEQLAEDQIMAYLHYPPTFYRLHVHLVHVDSADDGGTRAGRAHILDEVIRNLELDGRYYADRVMSIYLHDRSPMLEALRAANHADSDSK